MEKNDLEWLSSIVSFAKIMDIEFSGPGGVISQSGCKETVHNPPPRPLLTEVLISLIKI